MKRSTQITARAAALAAAAVLTLSACGTNADTEEPAAGSSEQQEPATTEETTQEPAETAPADSAAPAGEAVEVQVGSEFTDEETGDVVTVVSAIRNNPTEYYEAVDSPNGEMVYLQIKVVPGTNYGGMISTSDFYLDSAGNEVNYAASAKSEVEDAGYPYYESSSRSDGEATGYIPIFVDESAPTLKGAYVRPEAKVLGQDTRVPEFRAEFEVPAS